MRLSEAYSYWWKRANQTCRWRQFEGLHLVHHANAVSDNEIRKDILSPDFNWHQVREVICARHRLEELPYGRTPETRNSHKLQGHPLVRTGVLQQHSVCLTIKHMNPVSVLGSAVFGVYCPPPTFPCLHYVVNRLRRWPCCNALHVS
jgi:hypothetical protein